MKLIKLNTLFVSIFLVMLNGCETISSTSQFYRPTTTKIYPEKPKDYKVPILAAPPKEKYEVIGRISFSAGYGYGYMIKAIEYNARKAGADAVIMLDSSSSLEQYTYTVPGYTTIQPVTTYSSGTAFGRANYYGSEGYGYASGSTYGSSTSTTYIPVHHPAYTGVGSVVRHSIDAVMIVFK